jgi:hypothetical protein
MITKTIQENKFIFLILVLLFLDFYAPTLAYTETFNVDDVGIFSNYTLTVPSPLCNNEWHYQINQS